MRFTIAVNRPFKDQNGERPADFINCVAWRNQAEFLQKFAISQRYFADGDGWVESNSKYPIDAYEDSQWLFACGYYKE